MIEISDIAGYLLGEALRIIDEDGYDEIVSGVEKARFGEDKSKWYYILHKGSKREICKGELCKPILRNWQEFIELSETEEFNKALEEYHGGEDDIKIIRNEKMIKYYHKVPPDEYNIVTFSCGYDGKISIEAEGWHRGFLKILERFNIDMDGLIKQGLAISYREAGNV